MSTNSFDRNIELTDPKSIKKLLDIMEDNKIRKPKMEKQTKKKESITITLSDFIPEDGYTGNESIYKGGSIFTLCENELNHNIITDAISWQDILEYCFIEMSLLSGKLDGNSLADKEDMRNVVKPFMEKTGLAYNID